MFPRMIFYKMICFTFYYDKSPWNHHLGNICFTFSKHLKISWANLRPYCCNTLPRTLCWFAGPKREWGFMKPAFDWGYSLPYSPIFFFVPKTPHGFFQRARKAVFFEKVWHPSFRNVSIRWRVSRHGSKQPPSYLYSAVGVDVFVAAGWGGCTPHAFGKKPMRNVPPKNKGVY